jgi:hypothetical protein
MSRRVGLLQRDYTALYPSRLSPFVVSSFWLCVLQICEDDTEGPEALSTVTPMGRRECIYIHTYILTKDSLFR